MKKKATLEKAQYHVLYVESCEAKQESFWIIEHAEEFISQFLENATNDDWIDHVFYGTPLVVETRARLVPGTKK